MADSNFTRQMYRQTRITVLFVMFVLVALTVCGCAREYTLAPKEVGARRMTDTSAFSEEEREVAVAVIERLKTHNENPADFYMGPIKNASPARRELPVYHKAAFTEPQAPGNPGGRSRTMIYDVEQKRIVEEWSWQ